MPLTVFQCNVTVNIVLYNKTNAESVFCLEIFLCLKTSRHCVPTKSNVIQFTAVKEWPLTEPGMMEQGADPACYNSRGLSVAILRF